MKIQNYKQPCRGYNKRRLVVDTAYGYAAAARHPNYQCGKHRKVPFIETGSGREGGAPANMSTVARQQQQKHSSTTMRPLDSFECSFYANNDILTGE
jgi:hypothetical protein